MENLVQWRPTYNITREQQQTEFNIAALDFLQQMTQAVQALRPDIQVPPLNPILQNWVENNQHQRQTSTDIRPIPTPVPAPAPLPERPVPDPRVLISTQAPVPTPRKWTSHEEQTPMIQTTSYINTAPGIPTTPDHVLEPATAILVKQDDPERHPGPGKAPDMPEEPVESPTATLLTSDVQTIVTSPPAALEASRILESDLKPGDIAQLSKIDQGNSTEHDKVLQYHRNKQETTIFRPKATPKFTKPQTNIHSTHRGPVVSNPRERPPAEPPPSQDPTRLNEKP